MGKTYIIATGINHYQVFQPLNYAQHDAQAVWDFGVYQAGLPRQDCILLTDNSEPIEGRSTYPNRETIEGWIDDICGMGGSVNLSLTSADTLWWFFSGYGVSYQGCDYLMPIEGDPGNVEGTGISIRSLFSRLKGLPTDKILVILDINRANSTQSGSLLGTETSSLAREMEIPILLSSQPGQFSQETSDLRQGLFTAALMEGLRSGQCNTMSQLEQYLGRRLQELSDHHMRPTQQPLMVVAPPEKINQAILPLNSQTTADPEKGTPSQPGRESLSNQEKRSDRAAAELEDMQNDDAQFWRQLILTSAGLAVILIAGVFFRNKDLLIRAPEGSEFDNVQQVGSAPSEPLTVTEPPKEPANPPVVQAPTEPPKEPANPRVVQAPTESSIEPLTPEQPEIPLIVAEPPKEPANPPVVQAPAGTPIGSPTPDPAPVQPVSKEQANEDILGKARTSIGLNQASKYSNAITIARQIQPDEPRYAQAQEDINNWSRAILDISVGRSKLGNFSGAIAAAKLVPEDSDSYEEAQYVIELWTRQAQQQQANRELLNQAKQSLQPSQASSYSEAIAQVRKISRGQPEYFAAQQLINQWSNEILEIANRRAENGSLESAIAAASLVSEDAQAYEKAQEAIATWQEQLE